MCVCVSVCVCMCVCVCVGVIYFFSSLELLHIISDLIQLLRPVLFPIPAIRQLRNLPCYTHTTTHQPILVPYFVSVHPSRLSPQDLATPTRKHCYHYPIRQLWSLPNARPFVAMAAEEKAIRPHYC